MAEALGRRRGDGASRPMRIPRNGCSRKANLPENVTPDNSKLKDPEERNRIARVFERGPDRAEPDFVLPIQRWQSKASTKKKVGSSPKKAETTPDRWRQRARRRCGGNPRSGNCAAGHMFLVPGDSPVGYRLPLGSLPWIPPAQYPFIDVPADPAERVRCRCRSFAHRPGRARSTQARARLTRRPESAKPRR